MGFLSEWRDSRKGTREAVGAFKQMQEQALSASGFDLAEVQQMAAGATAPGAIEATQAYAAKRQRLYSAGVDTAATIVSAEPHTIAPVLGGEQARVTLNVAPAGGAPYQAVTDEVLAPGQFATLTPGTSINVRVDPADPASVMLYGATAPAAPPTPSADDRVTQLEKLAALHASGALTDDEFADQKRKLLGS
jgi:hypothetical protein